MRITSKNFFSESQRERIDAAVQQAEESTAGEIVPVLATAAEPYDRGLFYSALFFAGLFTLLVVGIYSLPLQAFDALEDPWAVPLYVLLPVQIVGLLVGYHGAVVLPGLHRAFTSHAYMQVRVDAAAHQAFHTFHLSHTKDATGIMIYVSLFERMVVVLADKAINDKHDKATWDGVRDRIIAGFKKNDPAAGFEEAITECGRILSEDFPIQPDDVDELPNHLRLV